jgi:acetylornithine deacetylase/succinyl-diaminopimelate desuccinylase-like protein
VKIAMECTRAQGLDPVLTAGSTDANIPLNRGFPAVVMGVTTGGGAHSTHEFIELEPVKKGLEGLVSFVCEVNK